MGFLLVVFTWIALSEFGECNDVGKTQSFPGETCSSRTLVNYMFKEFFPLKQMTEDGTFQELIRFKGIADGHILLSENASTNEPVYLIIIGSYNNQFSEIRRTKRAIAEVKESTPWILNDYNFRGFYLQYNKSDGSIIVIPEESDIPLLQWQDPEPLDIRFMSFSAWNSRTIQVAFDCKPKNSVSSSVTIKHARACQMDTLQGMLLDTFYSVHSFVNRFNVVELLVRFKGASDAHIALTTDAHVTSPMYMIILGSNNNKISEIRRSINESPVFKMNTPEIMSADTLRGFVIRYDEEKGEIWVFSEGSVMPLLHWKDSHLLSIPVNYFGFCASEGKQIEVAFNCDRSELHTILPFVEDATPDPKLRKVLLEKYDRLALPYRLGDTGTTITIPSITLTHFTINEETQTFELQAWIHMTWHDHRLNWTGDEGHLHFSPDEIWIPDITLYNNAESTNLNIYGKTMALATPNGTVIWVPPSKFTTLCDLNLRRWPHDKQKCTIKLGSWTYHVGEIDMVFGTTSEEKVKTMEELSKDDIEWEMLDINAFRESKKYNCCLEEYVSITYEFEMQRKSANYTYTVILPIILISLINLTLFLLPTNHGGRVTLGAVNFLILSVFLMFFRSRLPNVDHVPYMVMLYGWNLILVTISILTAAIVTNLSRLVGSGTPPQCLRLLTAPNFMSVLCLGHLAEPNKRSGRNSYKMGQQRSPEDAIAEEPMSATSPECGPNEWLLLGATLDRLSFLLYTTVTVVLLACFL